MGRIAAFVILLILPEISLAGAWQRDEGATFLSFSYTATAPVADWKAGSVDPDGFTAFYVERGLGTGLTLGLDAGAAEAGERTVIVFVSRALTQPDDKNQSAIQFGIGNLSAFASDQPLVQVAASLGRGLGGARGPGWMAADAQLHYRTETGEIVKKLDLTYGATISDRTRAIFQIQTGDYPGSDPYLRLAPSVVYRLSEGAMVEAGAAFGLSGGETFGLKIGTWLEF